MSDKWAWWLTLYFHLFIIIDSYFRRQLKFLQKFCFFHREESDWHISALPFYNNIFNTRRNAWNTPEIDSLKIIHSLFNLINFWSYFIVSSNTRFAFDSLAREQWNTSFVNYILIKSMSSLYTRLNKYAETRPRTEVCERKVFELMKIDCYANHFRVIIILHYRRRCGPFTYEKYFRHPLPKN